MYPLRSLVRTPGFTATALLTLALCLAANLVIFTAVDSIILRPLPFPEPHRLLTLINAYPSAGVARSEASLPNYFERRGTIDAFSSVSLIQYGSAVVGEAGSPNRVPTARVTPEFFATLEVPLARGQTFTDAQLAYGADQVAVLTHGFWRTHFNADPDVLGKTFFNDGLPVTVVGVLPPDFRFLSSRAQFFRPFSHAPDDRNVRNRHNNNCAMIARLAPGATLAQAQAQLDAVNASLLATDPYAESIKEAGFRTNIFLLHEDHVRETRPILLLLQGGALCLLLIGAVNLANLLLIRASGRTKEIAVRQALGASRRHLAREVFAETLLLALGGGTLGLLAGAFGVDALAHFAADQLPLGATIALDERSAAAMLGATLVLGASLAVPVIWFYLRTRLALGLQSDSRSGTSSRAAVRLRDGFIVVQVALAFVLLSGAALLGLSLKRAMETPTGFQVANILTGRIALPWKNYRDDAARLAFVERLLPAIRALPGVTHAAIAYDPPFTGGGSNGSVTVESYVPRAGEVTRPHHLTGASADYWAALGIPLLRGRFLEDADNRRSQRVCVVDQAFADRYWPGGDPIGQRIAVGLELRPDRITTIVGVVASVKHNELEEDAGQGIVYFPNRLFNSSVFSLVVKTALPPESLAPLVTKAILQLDPELPLDDVKSMQTLVDESLSARRAPAVLASIFAGAALLLASIGLYGVMAYAVTQRTREFGIRIALGAQPAAVLRLVFGQGVRLVGLGLVAGIAGALLLAGVMSSLLYQVAASDPLTLTLVGALLAGVAALACFLPARRATKVDPMIALRAE